MTAYDGSSAPTVLIAFSDTGGGHRAAARHLQGALARLAPDASVRLIDPYASSGRWPFDRLHAGYPVVVGRAAWLWHAGFRLTNTRWVTTIAQALAWPLLRRAFHALRAEARPDVIVSTHPLLATPLRRAFPTVPIAVVVTDLVSGHVSWYDRSADCVITPTPAATGHARRKGVPASRVLELGLPVDASFVATDDTHMALAASLGWSTARPTVLLMGGGDGIGPLESIATAVDEASLPCDLAIVTGRNADLAARLRRRAWSGCVHVYDFVLQLGPMMRAASALITKAGPGTICEAFAAGCPLVLYGAIPGQETGNVDYVRASGGGVWAPSPAAVVAALAQWFVAPDASIVRARVARAARAAAKPSAADDIVARVLALAAPFASKSPHPSVSALV